MVQPEWITDGVHDARVPCWSSKLFLKFNLEVSASCWSCPSISFRTSLFARQRSGMTRSSIQILNANSFPLIHESGVWGLPLKENKVKVFKYFRSFKVAKMQCSKDSQHTFHVFYRDWFHTQDLQEFMRRTLKIFKSLSVPKNMFIFNVLNLPKIILSNIFGDVFLNYLE